MGDTDRAALRDIAQYVNADGAELLEQTEAHLPVPDRELHLVGPVTDLVTLANSSARMQRNSESKRSYPADAVRKATQAFPTPSGSPCCI